MEQLRSRGCSATTFDSGFESATESIATIWANRPEGPFLSEYPAYSGGKPAFFLSWFSAPRKAISMMKNTDFQSYGEDLAVESLVLTRFTYFLMFLYMVSRA